MADTSVEEEEDETVRRKGEGCEAVNGREGQE